MRKLQKKFMRISITAILVFSLLGFQVDAAVDPAVQSKCANALVKLDLMRGDQYGNLKLDNRLRRCEFITLVIRMLGYENDQELTGVEMKFKDISPKHWAYNNMKIALKYKLITGYTDNTVRPDSYVTFTEARAVLIRALGYESTLAGKWPSNVINKSGELGLNLNLDLPDDRQITRGETAILVYNSLTVSFNQ